MRLFSAFCLSDALVSDCEEGVYEVGFFPNIMLSDTLIAESVLQGILTGQEQ